MSYADTEALEAVERKHTGKVLPVIVKYRKSTSKQGCSACHPLNVLCLPVTEIQ